MSLHVHFLKKMCVVALTHCVRNILWACQPVVASKAYEFQVPRPPWSRLLIDWFWLRVMALPDAKVLLYFLETCLYAVSIHLPCLTILSFSPLEWLKSVYSPLTSKIKKLLGGNFSANFKLTLWHKFVSYQNKAFQITSPCWAHQI